MKLIKLGNGNIVLTEDTDEVIRIFPKNTYVSRHPKEAAAMFSENPGIDEIRRNFVLFPAQLSDPVVADIDELMATLAVSFIGDGILVYAAPVTVVVTDESTEVIPANALRKGAAFFNDSGGTGNIAWFTAGHPAVVNQTLELAKGGAFFIEPSSGITTQAINAICATGKTTNITYQEAI